MKIFRFGREIGNHITKFDSNFIMSRIVQTEYPTHIGYIHLETKGKIGYHQAVIPQLLVILSGEGEVCGEDKQMVKVKKGEAVFWEESEWHETITDQGLIAVVIESKQLNPSEMMQQIEVSKVKSKGITMDFKIEKEQGYTPKIGHLVSMMNYARYTTLQAVKGLSTKELDFLPSEDGNSIGALLLHIAAVEAGFQIEIFENRNPNEEEAAEWGAAYGLGEQGRRQIKGNSLEFYMEKLDEVRNRTLEEFQKRDDKWLYEERLWDNHNSNHYFIWFHVFEDEINHRGQMRIIRKMLQEG